MFNNLNFELSELTRRLAGLINVGIVIESKPGAARVQIGGVKTAWLPVIATRAGANSTVSTLSENEQVVILAPSGDLAQGVVLPAIAQNRYPVPTGDPDETVAKYSDGTEIIYSTATKTLTANFAGDSVINVTGNATINAEKIAMNGGQGVVTGGCICHFTGLPHADISQSVTAGK